MAGIKRTSMFEELHGKFGKIVYRESYGTLQMSHVPDLTGQGSPGVLRKHEGCSIKNRSLNSETCLVANVSTVH